MNKSFALCVVTYYPENHLMARLSTAVSMGYEVYVYDNTPGGCGWDTEPLLQGIRWMGAKANHGMGKALHDLLQTVQQSGMVSALYLDQDTDFTEETLRWMDHWLMVHPGALQQWAALNFLPSKKGSECISPDVLMVSAGTLFGMQSLSKIGGHNVGWFLECVDYEWCGRALKLGYRLGRVKGCLGLDHQRFQPEDTMKLFGQSRHFRLYPGHRSWAFLRGLLYLGSWGLIHGMPRYAWACYRNGLTHIADQLRALCLLGIKRWGVSS